MLSNESMDKKMFSQVNMKYLELTQNKLKTSNEVHIISSVESIV